MGRWAAGGGVPTAAHGRGNIAALDHDIDATSVAAGQGQGQGQTWQGRGGGVEGRRRHPLPSRRLPAIAHVPSTAARAGGGGGGNGGGLCGRRRRTIH
eukprot:364344-Chlamydomonas_euryale.AAC.27